MMEDVAERGRLWIVAALLLGMTALWAWQLHLRSVLPNPQRVELYNRTFASVLASCTPPKPNLDDYCRDQATLLLDYPECDEKCVALVREVRREPGR
jgi:hypothetical protein